MQPRDYDAVVLVHGVGEGEHQGDFLVDVTEPLLRWVGENGGQIASITPQSLRRGERPPRLEVSGTIPDPQREDQRREFDWRFVEARWSDEFRPPPARSALGWSRRAYPEAVADQLCYYDSVWRFWRLLARLPSAGPAFRWLANGPSESADGDQRAWQYRYRLERSRRYKYPYALWFGLIAPLLLLAGASVALLPLAPVSLVTGLASKWEKAYFNAIYRLLLTLAWVPLVALGYVLLLFVTLLAAVPVGIPSVEPLRRRITDLVRLRFADVYVFNERLVQPAAIVDAVSRVIAEEAGHCRSLTVIAYSQGAVVAFEALSQLAHPSVPAAQAPILSVREAMAQIDSPLSRPGLRLRLITVVGALNRALAAPFGGDRLDAVRRLLDRPLPPGTRWVDIWSMHDPVPMGSAAARLCGRAGRAPAEVRTSNTLTQLSAHTSYWENEVEVIATVAEELADARIDAVGGESEAAMPRTWENPNRFGFWWWRRHHGGNDRESARSRRGVLLYALAAVRAAGYLFVGGVLLFTAFGGSSSDSLIVGVDGVPLAQTPMRWLWTPLASDAEAAGGGAFVASNVDDELSVVAGDDAGSNGERWRLSGPGEWLGWSAVRYDAFPLIIAAEASILFLAAFIALQRAALSAGERYWDRRPAADAA